MTRLSRFGINYNPYLVAQHEQSSARVEVFSPTRGLHRGDSSQDLAPGFTPNCANLIPDAGALTPRSGLSQFKGGSSKLSGAVLGAWLLHDEVDNHYLATASANTFSLYDPTLDSWSTLSYVKPSTATNLPSGTSRDYWDSASIYDASKDRFVGVFTNGINLPYEMTVKPSATTFSDLTNFASLASKARSVCAFDDRLVWWNIASSASSYPTRVLWSPRGLPSSYSLVAGAGFQDLMDVKGEGTRVVASRDGLVLFTDEEVWGARRRGDAYVFDFYPIVREFGCPYPKSVVETPFGTIFLSTDFELYIIQNGRINALGPVEGEGASRIRSFLQENAYEGERMWAVYNPASVRYELYFTGVESDEGFPTRALYYSFNDRAFWPQKFSHELSAGVGFDDPGIPLTWDGAGDLTWDQMGGIWDTQVTPGTGWYVNTFSSGGSAYRFYSTQTSDDGSAITYEWDSHGLNRADQMRFETLTELWMEYKSEQTVSLNVGYKGAQGESARTSNFSLIPATFKRAFLPSHAFGVAPQFTIQGADGTRPKIARFQATLRESGLYGGG